MTHSPRRLAALRQRGATVLVLPGTNGQLSLRRLMAVLGRRGGSSLLIEGGATLAAAALDSLAAHAGAEDILLSAEIGAAHAV